jgi:hypothetical protein
MGQKLSLFGRDREGSGDILVDNFGRSVNSSGFSAISLPLSPLGNAACGNGGVVVPWAVAV